jgi:hypothetical protein
MMTSQQMLDFVNKQISTLTALRDELHSEGSYVAEEYTKGAIDSYDIMRIKLEGKVELR